MNLKNPVEILRGGIFFFFKSIDWDGSILSELVGRRATILNGDLKKGNWRWERHYETKLIKAKANRRGGRWDEFCLLVGQWAKPCCEWFDGVLMKRSTPPQWPEVRRGHRVASCIQSVTQKRQTIQTIPPTLTTREGGRLDSNIHSITMKRFEISPLLDAAGRCGHVVGLFHHSDWPNLYFQFIRQQLPRPSIVVFQRLGNVGWPLPDSSSTAAATPTQSTENSQFWFVNNGRVTWPITSVNSHVLTFQMGSIWKMWRPSFKQLVSQLDAIVGLIGFARATSSHLATFNCFSGFWVTHPMFAS